MNWGWLFFTALVESIVIYIAIHWKADWKPLVTFFGLGTALPFVVILVYYFIKMQNNPAEVVAIGADAITATIETFVDALPSAFAGDVAGIVVGGVFGMFTRR